MGDWELENYFEMVDKRIGNNLDKYRDLPIVLPMHEPSIFRALNWVADVRKQIASAFK